MPIRGQRAFWPYHVLCYCIICWYVRVCIFCFKSNPCNDCLACTFHRQTCLKKVNIRLKLNLLVSNDFFIINIAVILLVKLCYDQSMDYFKHVNLLIAIPRKCSNALKQFVGSLLANCLSVFGHFVGLALKGLSYWKDKSHQGIRKLRKEGRVENVIFTYHMISWNVSFISGLL